MADYSEYEYTDKTESELTNGETCDQCKEFMTYKCSDCGKTSQDDDMCTSCQEYTTLTQYICPCGKHLCADCADKTVNNECMFCTTDFTKSSLVDKHALHDYLQKKYGIINLKKEFLLHKCGMKFNTLEDLCKRTLWLYDAITKKELLQYGADHIIRRFMAESTISPITS